MRRRSPSTARSRLGRIDVSRAAPGSLASSDSSRRVHRVSSTGSDLTYAHSYPRMWIANSALWDRYLEDSAAGIRTRPPRSRGRAVRREAPTPEWRTLAHAETPRQAVASVGWSTPGGPSVRGVRVREREPRTLGGLGLNQVCFPTHRFFGPLNRLTC